MQQYVLVYTDDTRSFETKVNKYLEQGYILYGHITANGQWSYVQAMVLPTTKEIK